MWNTLPDDVKSCTSLPSFKCLKNFFFNRLRALFDQDNIRSYKLICPKCRYSNPFNLCSCLFCLLVNVLCSGEGVYFIVSLVIGVQTLKETSCPIVCSPCVVYVHVSIMNF